MLDEDESRRWREDKCRVDRLYRLHVRLGVVALSERSDKCQDPATWAVMQ
jgi:hypothetical protein